MTALTNDTKVLFFFVILLSNLNFFLFWIYYFAFELKEEVIKKYGKVYLFLCLCGNQAKLEQLQKDILIQEEN